MKQLILLILLISLSNLTVAQSNLYKQYSSNGYDFGQGIVELPDSSYVLTGASSSFTEGPSQMFLLKVDSLGNFVWSKHYGGSETDWGRRVKYIENEGFFVGGYTNSSGNGAYDFALWKIDENGNEEWFKTYGTIGWERVHHMAITADKGVILVGETNNTNDGFIDIYIVRTDYDGNVLWEKQIENPGDDNALTITQFDDSTFIIGGYFYNPATEFKQAWLTRLQDNGTEIWTQTWGNDYNFDIADIEIYNQLIFGVGTRTLEGSEEYLFTSKIDSDGTVLASSVELSLNDVKGVGITLHQYIDAFCVGVSYSGTDFSYGLEDLFFYGYTQHPFYYGNLGGVQYATSQVFGEMQTTYGRGTIIVGYNENIGPGGSSIFILRIGSEKPYSDSGDDFTTTPLISVEQLASPSENLTIYPNPSTDKIRIKSGDTDGQLFFIRMNDLSGREILTLKTNNLNETVIDISTVEKGIYTMIIENESNTLIRKVEIK